MFGHHKGLTWGQVLHKYTWYDLWVQNRKDQAKGLADFLDGPTEHYIVEGDNRDPRSLIEVTQRDIPLSETPLPQPPARSGHTSLDIVDDAENARERCFPSCKSYNIAYAYMQEMRLGPEEQEDDLAS